MRDNKGYRKLIAWQKANELAHMVYNLTEKFPKNELFGLTSQMRRAALSVCANIAEGYSRRSMNDRRHFYQIATGSLVELEFFIDFAYQRKFIVKKTYQEVVQVQTETARVLAGLVKAT